jgi:tetratricopeptide (TPR) repeat protein
VFKKFGLKGGADKKASYDWQEKNAELVALINGRELDAAVELGQEMVDFVDRNHRRDTTEKATTYNNMGMVFMLAGDYELADESFRHALAMRKRIFGSDHNEVAVVLINMVQLYKIQADRIFNANRVETTD